MKIRNNLGSFYSTLGSNNSFQNLPSNVGRVFHVVSNSKSAGYTNDSDIGTVYILKNNSAPPTLDLLNSSITSDDLVNNGLKPVKPLFSNISYIPLIDELVLLFELPSYDSGAVSGRFDTYYLTNINLYNNPHHNSQGLYNVKDNNDIILGNYINELTTIRNLVPFEGDLSLNSRWGAGLHFSSTFKFNSNAPENFWSYSGKIGDPITMLVNGYNFSTSSLDPYVENINNDASSIYMTSTQTISNFIPKLTISKSPFTFLLKPEVYNNSQLILSSNRITLSSTKNEVVIYGATNIELGANNTIHLNGKESIYLNSPKVYLGQIKNQSLGTDNTDIPQPVMLGNNTQLFLSKLLNILNKFTSDLTLISKSSPKYSNIAISTFASNTQKSLTLLRDDLNNILSDSTFVSK